MSSDQVPSPGHVTASLAALGPSRPDTAIVDPHPTRQGRVRVWCRDRVAQHATAGVLAELGYQAGVEERTGDLLVTGWDTGRLATRAAGLEQTLREVEYRHVAVAGTALSRFRRCPPDLPGAREEALRAAGASRETWPGQASLPVTVTAADLATAAGPVRELLVRVAAAEQALSTVAGTPLADTAQAAIGLYQEYRDVHGYDGDTAQAQAFTDVGDGTRAVWDLALATTSLAAQQPSIDPGQLDAAYAAGEELPGFGPLVTLRHADQSNPAQLPGEGRAGHGVATARSLYRDDGSLDALAYWSARARHPDPATAAHAQALCDHLTQTPGTHTPATHDGATYDEATPDPGAAAPTTQPPAVPLTAAEVTERGLWDSVFAVYREPYGPGDEPAGYRQLLDWDPAAQQWTEPTDVPRSADGTADRYPGDERPPGDQRCADAVAAAHEAVRADAGRVTGEPGRGQPARAPADSEQRGAAAGQPGHDGGHRDE